MKHPLVAAALLIPLLALAGEASAAASASRGRLIAQRNCGGCHAIGKTGQSANPKSPPFRTLGTRYPLRDLEESLAEGITVGHEGVEMPTFEFRPGQIADLMAYLTSIQKRRR